MVIYMIDGIMVNLEGKTIVSLLVIEAVIYRNAHLFDFAGLFWGRYHAARIVVYFEMPHTSVYRWWRFNVISEPTGLEMFNMTTISGDSYVAIDVSVVADWLDNALVLI